MHARSALALLPVALLAACEDPLVPSERPTPRADLAASAILTVNTLADSYDGTCDASDCSLRDALAEANAASGSTIDFGVTGTIALGTQLVIAAPMTIAGPGAAMLTIDGMDVARVFFLPVPAAPVTISGVTLARGAANAGLSGGCLQNEGAVLSLVDVVVRDCFSDGAGGGIGNSAGGQVTLLGSTVRDNRASNGGGGIYNDHNATLTVERSTISGNVGREGGGIGSTGPLTVTNSTISGNTARALGGGIWVGHRQNVQLVARSATIVWNTATGPGGGLAVDATMAHLTGVVLANNVSTAAVAAECFGNVPGSVLRHTLVEQPAGCDGLLVGAVAPVLGVDPNLGPLADNGGDTFTHLPLAGSPAIDAGGPTCPVVDQRALPRPIGPACDIGAVEVQPWAVTIDVKPGSATNPVSVRAGGTLPVAVLSTADFDARTIVVSSLRLNGQEVAIRSKTQGGGYMASYEDVNGDGRLDLVVHFTVKQVVSSATTSATLIGTSTEVGPISGTDVVTVVP